MDKDGEGQVKQGEEMSPWINSMKLILGSLHNKYVQACGISMVPEQLRKLKMEAYMPKIVSIGPLHKGTRTDLQYMEEIKWRCTHYLLYRARPVEEVQQRLKKCSEKILTLDELVRASYNVNDIKFDRHDLAKIMVLDGCFLLELLISGSEALNSKLKYSLGDDSSPAAKVIRREEVLSDLIILENQIPLLVLKTLSKVLFPHVFTDNHGEKIIHDLALSLLGYTPVTNFNGVSYFIGPYTNFRGVYDLIELVYCFIDEEERRCLPNTAVSDEAEGSQRNKHHSIPVAGDKDAKMSHKKLKLKRCATSLQAAGVKIKPTTTEAKHVELPQSFVQKLKGNILVQMVQMLSWLPEIRRIKRELAKKNPPPTEIRFDFKIRFEDRELEIPPLHITETTEHKWRNFIAWEVNRTLKEKFIRDETITECKFILYARFFQGLICCVHDVQLLRDKNVIVVHEVERNEEEKIGTMSNEDLLHFFRKLTEGVRDDLNYLDSRFSELFKKLNKHPSAWNCATGICTITRHRIRCCFTRSWYFCRQQYRELRRVHIPTGWKLIAIAAAAAGLALTAVQTFYSVRGY